MYLVTGGAGFIGSNIVRTLVAAGEKVRVFDDFSTGKRDNLAGLYEVEIVEGSLNNQVAVSEALADIKYVLHQGAIPSVPRSIADPLASNEANVSGTLNLLAEAKKAGIQKFVFAASSSAYGNTEVLPKQETMPGNPLSPYAVSKYAGELYARVFADIYGLQTVSLRYFNIFGPYQDPASEYAAVIPKFIKSMLKGKAPVIFGDGEQSRDFTYIDNAVAANLLACKSDQVGRGEVINIACGKSFTLNQLVEEVNNILGTSIKPTYAEHKPGDVKHSMADITQAQELLGYKVIVDFKEGLKRTVEWFKDNAQ